MLILAVVLACLFLLLLVVGYAQSKDNRWVPPNPPDVVPLDSLLNPPATTPAPAPTGKTGKLVYDGRKNLGFVAYDWYKCVDCLSVYPSTGGHPICNRTPITLCPWCRPDSKPNCYGRGN